MNKKSIAIGILSMFLLTSVASLSTAEMETEASSQTIVIHDDLPDLTISFSHRYFGYDWKSEGYYTSITIKNIGTKAVYSYETLKFRIEVEKKGEVVYWETLDWSKYLPLEPGDEIAYSISVGGHENPLPGFASLRAIVDPDNLILEISDTNNVDVRKWPYIGAYDSQSITIQNSGSSSSISVGRPNLID